ncbi:hypothetical protein [Cyclobacterium plantarum]|uniref:Uncharacterized protein n=1 Tax=Cyclobacterium plantarum TaxID=2716263 RepID=A0ABX0HCQ5_9BACT|nr:hypothetical protein [Cyclobacterium plantarum]NHE59499.1 hypothetical protein [Cyclobacterium plantarum]
MPTVLLIRLLVLFPWAEPHGYQIGRSYGALCTVETTTWNCVTGFPEKRLAVPTAL